MGVATAGAKVLIVEDDEDTCVVFSAGLGHAGYRVLTAMTGIDGLRIARDEHPDVILLDLSLAGADGRPYDSRPLPRLWNQAVPGDAQPGG